MALNQFMHPRNPYKHKKPDFAALAVKYPDFKRHLSTTLTGKVSLDFKDPEALRSLTCTLLKEDLGIDLVIPLDRIIPTVPLRLNYILWIEDLLEQSGHRGSEEIYGMDVGCGASCIYPLLGAKLNGWHFAASEVDPTAAGFAALNVKRNNFSDKIHVIEAEPDDMLLGIAKASPRSLYHFTVCNPPFFGNLLEAQGIMASRSAGRAQPVSISTAAEGEMIWEDGGEVDFVGRLIGDSLQLREQVVWYSSMVGKKASIGPIKKMLAKHKIRNVMTTEFCQGRTMRWGIAWTFYDDIKLPVMSPAKKFRRDKERPPLVIHVPHGALQRALGEVSPGSKVKSGVSEDQCKVRAVAKVVEKLLGNLEIDFKTKSAPKVCSSYALTAHRNTWSNQRRRRRQMSRRLPLDEGSPSAAGTTTTRPCPDSADCGPACDNVAPRNSTDAKPNVGESSSAKGADFVQNSGNDCGSVSRASCNAEDGSVKAVSEEASVDTSKEQCCISGDESVKPPTQMLSEDCLATDPGIAESKTGQVRPPEGSRQVPAHSASADPTVAPKGPAANSVSADADGSGGRPGPLGPTEDSKPGAECLFKCLLTVKVTQGKVAVELSWTEGQSRESMHQVGQYIKNHLNKMAEGCDR